MHFSQMLRGAKGAFEGSISQGFFLEPHSGSISKTVIKHCPVVSHRSFWLFILHQVDQQTVFWKLYAIFFCFIGPYSQHMEVPRLGVKLELQLLPCTDPTATAM